MPERLSAITLQQPWASAMLAGVKPWENRTWAPRRLRREPVEPLWVALHAGAQVDKGLSRPERGYRFGRGWALLREAWPECPGGASYAWPRGFLGLVQFDGVQPFEEGQDCFTSPWAGGPWCWRVGLVLPLPEPIPAQGAQGLWPVPEPLVEPFRDLYRAHVRAQRAAESR